MTTFPLTKVQHLRTRASKCAEAPGDGPDGWSISSVDPMKVLAVFKPLWIKNGYVLRAYQYRCGGNGNGIVWAMPIDADFPDPEHCHRVENVFLEPPKPPVALADVMEAIDGDGSAWSYLCASLLCRELHEFGAMWHGCSWSTQAILGTNPWKGKVTTTKSRWDTPSKDAANWTWLEPEPPEWRPHVYEDRNEIAVTFFTYSGLGQESICQYTDRFQQGNYCFTSQAKQLAAGTAGYIS